jgi:uncharacterized protein (TIGR02145 family)
MKKQFNNMLAKSLVALLFSTLLLSCSNDQKFKTVTIGDQLWMAKNLNVDEFHNGDLIPHAHTAEEWQRAGENEQPAWCYYNNDPANGKIYGKLYNWYAVNDRRGLAPEGYRIPSNEDFIILLGGEDVDGSKLEDTEDIDTEITYWSYPNWEKLLLNPNTGVTNKTSFTAFPCG